MDANGRLVHEALGLLSVVAEEEGALRDSITQLAWSSMQRAGLKEMLRHRKTKKLTVKCHVAVQTLNNDEYAALVNERQRFDELERDARYATKSIAYEQNECRSRIEARARESLHRVLATQERAKEEALNVPSAATIASQQGELLSYRRAWREDYATYLRKRRDAKRAVILERSTKLENQRMFAESAESERLNRIYHGAEQLLEECRAALESLLNGPMSSEWQYMHSVMLSEASDLQREHENTLRAHALAIERQTSYEVQERDEISLDEVNERKAIVGRRSAEINNLNAIAASYQRFKDSLDVTQMCRRQDLFAEMCDAFVDAFVTSALLGRSRLEEDEVCARCTVLHSESEYRKVVSARENITHEMRELNAAMRRFASGIAWEEQSCRESIVSSALCALRRK